MYLKVPNYLDAHFFELLLLFFYLLFIVLLTFNSNKAVFPYVWHFLTHHMLIVQLGPTLLVCAETRPSNS